MSTILPYTSSKFVRIGFRLRTCAQRTAMVGYFLLGILLAFMSTQKYQSPNLVNESPKRGGFYDESPNLCKIPLSDF